MTHQRAVGAARVRLRPAREARPDARSVHARHQREIAAVVPTGVLELTGGSSIDDALTRGDVDLHLRVPPHAFRDAVEALMGLHVVVHPEIWAETLATFVDRDDASVGIAVTPIGSIHDRRFTQAWAWLRTDGRTLAAYNAMKRRHARDPDAYERAKSAFFDELLERGAAAAPSPAS